MGMFDPNRNRNAPPQAPRRGIGGRLIAGIAIALIAWFMYANQVQENPVTGEKQHVAISPDQEIRLGLESAPQMAKEMGGEVPASDPRTIEVKRMGKYLSTKSDAQKSPWKFDFHLLADKNTVNAFALPGGQIFITLALLDRLQTEAQLAGVLGHEMGHVIERHSAQQMAKSQLGNLLVVAVGTAASDSSAPGTNPMMIAAMVNQMVQLRYGRKDESQADEWGLKIMMEAGYDPWAMIEVMKILKAATAGKGGGKTPEMFQTHPNPDLRMQQITDYLKEHPPQRGLTEGRNLKEIYSTGDYTS